MNRLPLAEMDEVDLLNGVRARRDVCFGELFRRHHPTALRYAVRLLRRHGLADAADDVVSDAFRKVLISLRNGKGPRDGFLRYLLIAVRAMVFNHLYRTRDRVVDLLLDPPRGEALGADGLLAVEAFKSLPQRWREVLWATRVMDVTPAEFGRLTGLTPNSAAALSLRARDALRVAYVRAHLPPGRRPECRTVLDELARSAVARGGVKAGDVDPHLTGCSACSRALVELRTDFPNWFRASRANAHGGQPGSTIHASPQATLPPEDLKATA